MGLVVVVRGFNGPLVGGVFFFALMSLRVSFEESGW